MTARVVLLVLPVVLCLALAGCGGGSDEPVPKGTNYGASLDRELADLDRAKAMGSISATEYTTARQAILRRYGAE